MLSLSEALRLPFGYLRALFVAFLLSHGFRNGHNKENGMLRAEAKFFGFNDNQAKDDGGSEGSGCGLYIGESTIPNAGLGIFTAIAKEEGDTVGNGDVCIPLLDMSWHNGDDFFNPFADYVWAGEVMGAFCLFATGLLLLSS